MLPILKEIFSEEKTYITHHMSIGVNFQYITFGLGRIIYMP
jgi:hypothetical protein